MCEVPHTHTLPILKTPPCVLPLIFPQNQVNLMSQSSSTPCSSSLNVTGQKCHAVCDKDKIWLIQILLNPYQKNSWEFITVINMLIIFHGIHFHNEERKYLIDPCVQFINWSILFIDTCMFIGKLWFCLLRFCLLGL